MKISYCSTVFNRFWQLKQTLPHNLKKIKDDPNTDLILINFSGDDCNDITNFIQKNFSWELISGKLKYFIRKQPWQKFNVSLAKNRAYRFATGDIFVNLDCDNLLQQNDPSIIRNIYLNSPSPQNLILHQTNGTSALKSKYLIDRYHLFDETKIDFSKENTIYDGTFGRISIHRDMFNKLNGYNENLKGMGMEDLDLLIRGIKMGGEYVFRSQPVNLMGKNFIPQPDQDKEHNNNQKNWKLMDEYLSKGDFSPKYEITETDEMYIIYKTDYDIEESLKYKLTLFTSIFKCDDFIISFIKNVLEIEGFQEIFFIWFYFVNATSNKKQIDLELSRIKKKYKNVKIFELQYDIGLYNSWNEMIKLTKSPYVGNFNPDDLRSPLFYNKIKSWINLFPDADILTGTYIPVYSRYSNFNEAIKENKNIWFNSQLLVDEEGKIKYNKFENEYRVVKEDLMFQLVLNQNKYEIKSFCIPNSAPVWKRELHNKYGFFKQNNYGTYTDFYFWLVCLSNGSKLYQFNDALSLFYVSDSQAHKTMDNSVYIFNRIILKFGNKYLKRIFYDYIEKLEDDLFLNETGKV